MAKAPTPKSDALRAMREARFAEMQSRQKSAPWTSTRPAAPSQEDVDAVKPKRRKKKEQ